MKAEDREVWITFAAAAINGMCARGEGNHQNSVFRAAALADRLLDELRGRDDIGTQHTLSEPQTPDQLSPCEANVLASVKRMCGDNSQETPTKTEETVRHAEKSLDDLGATRVEHNVAVGNISDGRQGTCNARASFTFDLDNPAEYVVGIERYRGEHRLVITKSSPAPATTAEPTQQPEQSESETQAEADAKALFETRKKGFEGGV